MSFQQANEMLQVQRRNSAKCDVCTVRKQDADEDAQHQFSCQIQ